MPSKTWKPIHSAKQYLLDQIKPGDLIGFSAYSCLGVTINRGTFGVPFWDLSHIAIAAWLPRKRGRKRRLVLYESTTLVDEKCLIQKEHVSGTQCHGIEERLAGYRGAAWHYPLAMPIDDDDAWKLTDFLASRIGTNYDTEGAFFSGAVGTGFRDKFLLRKEDLSSLFCSEYCAAGHREIKMLHTKSTSRWSPNGLARTERRRGTVLRPIRLPSGRGQWYKGEVGDAK